MSVHVMREHSAMPGAFRLICGASQREEYGWVLDIDHVAEPGRWGAGGQTENDFGEVDCQTCLAVLQREAVSENGHPGSDEHPGSDS